VTGQRVVLLLDLSREKCAHVQVPFAAEEATTTTARPSTRTARSQEATTRTTTDQHDGSTTGSSTLMTRHGLGELNYLQNIGGS
jgi:hypothetical protein